MTRPLTEVSAARKRQAQKIMPLIGPFLDAWDALPNDVAGLPELSEVRRYAQRIHRAMEDDDGQTN